ncbi:MAG: NifB/NifX family molybdenum-iron cluster-binding protein [Salinivirgaceae bacterium]
MKIAIAVNNEGTIQTKHFGEAAAYLIFEKQKMNWSKIKTLQNTLQNYDEVKHGSTQKGEGVVKILKNEGIKAAVSQQYGKNIEIISQYFIPIITSTQRIEDFLKHLDATTCNKIAQTNANNSKGLRIP